MLQSKIPMNESWRHSHHRDAALPSRASLTFSFQHLGKNPYKIVSKHTTEGSAVYQIWGTANNLDKNSDSNSPGGCQCILENISPVPASVWEGTSTK